MLRPPLLPIALLSVLSAASTAASPVLWRWPLLLMALCPRMLFLALAAKGTSLGTFLLVGTVRLCIGDPFHFAAGRLYGVAALNKGGAGWFRRKLVFLQRGQRRLSPLIVAVRPTGNWLAWAGANGACSRRTAVADITGTVVYCCLIYAGSQAWQWHLPWS